MFGFNLIGSWITKFSKDAPKFKRIKACPSSLDVSLGNVVIKGPREVNGKYFCGSPIDIYFDGVPQDNIRKLTLHIDAEDVVWMDVEYLVKNTEEGKP